MHAMLGKDWDDELEPETLAAFEKWLARLPEMKTTTVPRCLIGEVDKTPHSTELHVFCDASDKAMAAVSFVRVKYDDDLIHCAYVLGKAKVAPIKTQSVPRLELMAAVLGVEIYLIISKESRLRFDGVYFWSDSMTVLRYIQSNDLRLPVFEKESGDMRMRWRRLSR